MKRLSASSSGWVGWRWSVGLLAVRMTGISAGVFLPGVLPGVIGGTVLMAVMAPAQAYTAEDLLTVYRVEGEDYNALVRRAEITARSSAQQKFDRDILLTRVVITVLGQNGGQTAPILVLDVNRNDWRNRPDPQYWAKYYRSTRILLELDGSTSLQTAPPTPAPSPAIPGGPPLDAPFVPGGSPAPGQATPSTQLLPSGANSPPSINIPAAPVGQVGLPRAILRQ